MSDRKVISIVERLEHRRMSRLRTWVSTAHVREAELTVLSYDQLNAIKETDYDAAIAQAASLPPDQARLTRADLRCARGLQRCLFEDPDAGLAEWAEVAAETPDFAQVYLIRARWVMASDPAAALADFDRAAELDPTNAHVYWRRGDCYAALDDQDRALANYRRAAGLDPTLLDLHQTMGELHASRGEHAEAVRAFDRAIALGPGYIDLHLGRATALEALGDLDGAARDFGRIVELDPSRNNARYCRVLCLERSGQARRALEEMERVAEHQPGDGWIHRKLGKLRLDQGQVDAAIASLTRAVELDPEDAAAYGLRAQAHWLTQDKARGFADFNRAAELAPDEPQHVAGRTILRIAGLSAAEARAELDRVLAEHPDCGPLFEQRADALEKLGEPELALADLERAVALWPDNVSARLARSRVYAALGRVEDALEETEQVLRIEPRNALGYMGRALFRDALRGDRALVEADIDRAVELAPDDPVVRYYRGWDLRKRGEYAAALADYDAGIAAAPSLAKLYFERASCRMVLDEERGAADETPEEQRARLVACVEDLDRAVALGLRTEAVFILLAETLVTLDEVPRALEVLTRGIGELPQSCQLQERRAELGWQDPTPPSSAPRP